MKTSIEEAWRKASEKVSGIPPGSPENYVIFRLDQHSTRGIYGGVDGDGSLLLAIETEVVPPVIELYSSALDYFRHERNAFGTWLMVLRLRRRELSPVFGTLCQDLIDEIEGVANDEVLIGTSRRRIFLWKKLFEDGRDGLLADFQIKGLIAELLFMESQMASGARQPREMASAWAGPAGGDQDFIFSDDLVEVKAIGPNSDGVSISSLQQLESSERLRLSVWTMRSASPKEPGSHALNDVVARVEQYFNSDPQALAMFRDSLLEVGYVANPHYDDIAFDVMGVEEFIVDDEFPRLTAGTVPVGVAAATYVISLQSIRSKI